MNDQEELIATSLPFLEQIKNMTAGTDVERWLNATHGPGSPLYERLAALVKAGVRDGWAANVEIRGERYRRSRISEATPQTLGFSITTVYMDSKGYELDNDQRTFRGDYHQHPYGELNMVIPLDEGAVLAGPRGWQGAGWTAPSPGSHHFPEVKGGALIAFFFLPAGRISYDFPAQAS